jgi:hypothetical protein
MQLMPHQASSHQKNQDVKGNWMLLIRLEPRMFCIRSRNHTSRPTGHDDAIRAVWWRGAARIFGYYTAYAAPSFIKSAAVLIKKNRM